MKLSIVVPIYKVESYLRKCVDSLLNQDLSKEDYEIILVDDGSPDRCGEICDEYASRYANIRVVHRKNGGLSAARNSGIEVAQGKYIQFVDSDDYLEPNVLKTLIEKMETDNLDVLRFNYRNVNENYEEIHPNKDPKRFVDYRDEVCDGITFLNERLGPACYVWQFVIRKDLLTNAGIRFKEGIYFEDTEWTPRMLMVAERVTSIDMLVYDYLLRIGSITQSVERSKQKKLLEDRLSLIDSLSNQMECLTDKSWYESMVAQTIISVISGVSGDFYNDRKHYIKELQKKSVFPLLVPQTPKSYRWKIILANISPYLLCFLLHKRIN